MKIALVGAFDRNNYGDVLMPILFEKRLNMVFENVEYFYYGLQKSDMSSVKGVNTRSLKELYNPNNKFDVVVIVGGQVLTSDYKNMYLNLQKNPLYIFMLKCLSKVFKKTIEKYCKKRLSGKEIQPWIIDKDKINCKLLIYNTVGGKSIKNNDQVFDTIKKIDYISAREKGTYDVIKKIKKDVKLYPDSVISLSYILDDSVFDLNVRKELKNSLNDLGNYFVFQVKNKIGKESVDDIAAQIEEVYNKTGLSCVLLPIGYAQGHEDQIVLKKIYKKIKTPVYFSYNNIYETAYIIKMSKLYIGTSLHGAITSISYGIPHMALTNKITKLIDFLETWNTTPIVYTSITDLSNNTKKIMNDSNAFNMVNDSRKKLFKQADNNFDEIVDLIKRNKTWGK